MGFLRRPKESDKQLGVNSPGFKNRLSIAKSKGKRKPSSGQKLEEQAYKDYGITNKKDYIKPMEAPMRPKRGMDAAEGSAVVHSGTGASVSVAGDAQYEQADTSIGDTKSGGSIRRKRGVSSVLGVI